MCVKDLFFKKRPYIENEEFVTHYSTSNLVAAYIFEVIQPNTRKMTTVTDRAKRTLRIARYVLLMLKQQF